MESQCWICPYCYDDHNAESPCKEQDIKDRIKTLQDENNFQYDRNKQNRTNKEDAQREKHNLREENENLKSTISKLNPAVYYGLLKDIKSLQEENAKLRARIEAYEKEDNHEAMGCYLEHKELKKLKTAAEKACWVLEKCVIQFWEGLDSELPQLITRTEMDQALAVLTECGIKPHE